MTSTTLGGIFGLALLGAGMTMSGVIATAASVEEHVTIPSSAQGIWHAIDGQMLDLQDLVAKGTLKSVHMHAFAVRDLVHGLASHSPGLTAAAMAQVSTQSKFVDTLAARLDATNRIGALDGQPPNAYGLSAKVRSLAKPVPVTLEGELGGEAAVTIRFAAPEYGVAPGQAAVLYAGERVVGGGWIGATEAG